MVRQIDIKSAVEKAIARSAQVGDLEAIKERARDRTPEQLNSPRELADREHLLREFYRDPVISEKAFERIIKGKELQDVSYLPRGELVARTVMRVVLRGAGGANAGYGTGFLIGDGVLLTNNHVLPNLETARTAEIEAFFERDVEDRECIPWRFATDCTLYETSPELDFSIVGVAPLDLTGTHQLAQLGWLPLLGEAGKAAEGEWLSIIQHPGGERKQLCIRENQLLKREGDVLWYSTDTLAGSSGSPVFNNDWLVVALHHAGVPETRDGVWLTVDGRPYDKFRDGEDDIKWIANEGIRISRIVETLQKDPRWAANPRIQALCQTSALDLRARLPVLYAEGARPLAHQAGALSQPTDQTNPGTATAVAATLGRKEMEDRIITVRMAVSASGHVSLLDQAGGATESLLLERSGSAEPKNVISAPVEPAKDWIKGFDTDFLGGGALRVNLPIVGDKAKIAPLRDAYGQTFTAEERALGVLNYNGFAVVMNKERKFAFYSAANVNAAMRSKISGRDDDWLFDDRIDRDFQVDNSYYRANKFDRGHLTRREDMEWGESPKDAVRRANGTCTWTNCTPQQEKFNQNKDPSVELWHGLEEYILEQTVIHDQFKAQVITGPVFGAGDPVYRGLPYPLQFWKVVVAVAANGKLFATAYLLSQEATIAKFGIEVAGEQPFGQFATYQCRIAKIEDLTGLRFTYGPGKKSLSEVDPLAAGAPRTRKSRGTAGPNEAFALDSGSGLRSFDELVLPL